MLINKVLSDFSKTAPKLNIPSVTFAGNNRFERSPEGDAVELSDKPQGGTWRDIGRSIVEGIANKTEQLRQERERKHLLSRCEDMIGNYRKTQQEFSEIYMRKDINPNKTFNIIREFNEIEGIRISGDRDKYIHALFNEAKKNFGFEDLPLELRFTNKPIMGDERINAFTTPLGDVVMRDDVPIKDVLRIIHHELRHVKQRSMAFYLSPEEYVKASQPKDVELPPEIFCIAFGEPQRISASDMDFAQKSLYSVLTYCPVNKSEDGYYTQWAEDDARKTEQKIEKLLR